MEGSFSAFSKLTDLRELRNDYSDQIGQILKQRGRLSVSNIAFTRNDCREVSMK